MSLGPHTVQLLTPVTVVDHGTAVADWSQEPTAMSVSGCSWQPGVGTNDTQNRAGVQASVTVWLPPDAPVTAKQHVRFAGLDYEIVGEPERWIFGSGLDHVVVRLNRWEG